MRLLVTGGSGMVGSHLLPALAAEHSVRVFDLVPPPPGEWAFFQGDLLDAPALVKALRDCDAVLHLAAVPSPNHADDPTIMRVNVMGSDTLLRAAVEAEVPRVLLASSDSTFGFVFGRPLSELEFLPLNEDHSCKPHDAYGLSKLLVEEIAARYSRAFGLDCLCLRYCWIWTEETYSALEAFQQDETHAPRTLFTYFDVQDLARAVLRALALPLQPGRCTPVLLAAADSFRPEPTLELVRRFFPEVPALKFPGRYLLENPFASLYDCSRARALLDFEPRFSWRDGGTAP